jgi:CheY-like chemotaxis protein
MTARVSGTHFDTHVFNARCRGASSSDATGQLALDLADHRCQRRRIRRVTVGGDALVELGAVEPQLIVRDLTLPEIDGFEFIRRVRTRSGASAEAQPALALSASGRQEDPQRALHAGFQSFAGKPIDTGALLPIISRLARSRRPPG